MNSRKKVSIGISNLKRGDRTMAKLDTEKAEEHNTFLKDVLV